MLTNDFPRYDLPPLWKFVFKLEDTTGYLAVSKMNDGVSVDHAVTDGLHAVQIHPPDIFIDERIFVFAAIVFEIGKRHMLCGLGAGAINGTGQHKACNQKHNKS